MCRYCQRRDKILTHYHPGHNKGCYVRLADQSERAGESRLYVRQL